MLKRRSQILARIQLHRRLSCMQIFWYQIWCWCCRNTCSCAPHMWVTFPKAVERNQLHDSNLPPGWHLNKILYQFLKKNFHKWNILTQLPRELHLHMLSIYNRSDSHNLCDHIGQNSVAGIVWSIIYCIGQQFLYIPLVHSMFGDLSSQPHMKLWLV
jgi:hypothetical protein